MDCSPPGSSVHGILRVRIVEWVAIPFSRGFSWPRDQTEVSRIAGRFFIIWATREEYLSTISLSSCIYWYILQWWRNPFRFLSYSEWWYTDYCHSSARTTGLTWYSENPEISRYSIQLPTNSPHPKHDSGSIFNTVINSCLFKGFWGKAFHVVSELYILSLKLETASCLKEFSLFPTENNSICLYYLRESE